MRGLTISHNFFLSVRELSSVYDRHLNRPTMDDDDDEDHQIRDSTQQLSQVNKNSKLQGKQNWGLKVT